MFIFKGFAPGSPIGVFGHDDQSGIHGHGHDLWAARHVPGREPEDAAKACSDAAEKKRNLLYFPHFWWLIMGIIKAIPEAIFKRLKL